MAQPSKTRSPAGGQPHSCGLASVVLRERSWVPAQWVGALQCAHMQWNVGLIPVMTPTHVGCLASATDGEERTSSVADPALLCEPS